MEDIEMQAGQRPNPQPSRIQRGAARWYSGTDTEDPTLFRDTYDSVGQIAGLIQDWRLAVVFMPFTDLPTQEFNPFAEVFPDRPPVYPDGFDDFQKAFAIPYEFVDDTLSGVTHAIGIRPDGDGHVLWMNLLVGRPSNDRNDFQPRWKKTGLVVRWRQVPAHHHRVSESEQHDGYGSRDAAGSVAEASSNGMPEPELNSLPQPSTVNQVTVVAFGAHTPWSRTLFYLGQRADWESLLEHPYHFLDVALEVWFGVLNQTAWQVTTQTREVEKHVFKTARSLQATPLKMPYIDLSSAHTISKNAMFLMEGIDAVNRVIDTAMELENENLSPHDSKTAAQLRVFAKLRRRREHYQALRLRMNSSVTRIKNAIDLAFHVQTRHDGSVALRDSRSVRSISVLGVVFLPFTSVCAVFGMQFFNFKEEPLPDGSTRAVFYVDDRFWLFWTIALPVTLIVVSGWLVWDRYSEKLRNDKIQDLVEKVSQRIAWSK